MFPAIKKGSGTDNGARAVRSTFLTSPGGGFHTPPPFPNGQKKGADLSIRVHGKPEKKPATICWKCPHPEDASSNLIQMAGDRSLQARPVKHYSDDFRERNQFLRLFLSEREITANAYVCVSVCLFLVFSLSFVCVTDAGHARTRCPPPAPHSKNTKKRRTRGTHAAGFRHCAAFRRVSFRRFHRKSDGE